MKFKLVFMYSVVLLGLCAGFLKAQGSVAGENGVYVEKYVLQGGVLQWVNASSLFPNRH